METFKGKIRWIDIQDPTSEDLSFVQKEFSVHPIILQELLEHTSRPRTENYGSYIYFVFHFPLFDPVEKVSHRSEVDFIITKNAVITAHYDSLTPIAELKEELARLPRTERFLDSTIQTTYRIIDALIRFNLRQMAHIQEKVESVSSELFHDREKQILTQISYLKRDISEHRIIVRPQEHLLRSFEDAALSFWGGSAKVYISDLIGEHMKIVDLLEDYRQAVMDFENTNVQLMNFKSTKSLSMFTALSFLTFPFVVIVGLFAARTGGIPLEGNPYGFWILTIAVAAGILSMFLYFRKKEWL